MGRAVTAVAVVTAWAVLAGCGGGAAEKGAEAPRTPRPPRTAESASPTPSAVDPEAYWADVVAGLDDETRPADGPARVRHPLGDNVSFAWETADGRFCWALKESLGSSLSCTKDPMPLGHEPRVREMFRIWNTYGDLILFVADHEKVTSLSCGSRDLPVGGGETLSDGRRTVYAVHVPDSQPEGSGGATSGRVTVEVDRSSGPATEYLQLEGRDDMSAEMFERSSKCR
ncbi:hypothetical protein [Streptomyces sp. NPDC056600]|uniref:hypothetical protein n=1 Tax=Streptomyces sp. NPDC056600 TaxID=3345874 RepID=UPI0036C082B6